jgi:PAS domain S-box-containing protein
LLVSRAVAGVVQGAAGTSAAGVSVLVAEDDEGSRAVLAMMLGRWGYVPVLAADGVEAWDVLCRDDAPGVALLDWMMPGLDGVELCRRLRAVRETRAVYTILVTARSGSEHVATALDAGADDFVRKPFDREELRARIGVGVRVVDLQRGQLAQARELREREEHLRAVVTYAKDGIVVVDGRGVIRSFNPAAERIFGEPAAIAAGRAFNFFAPQLHVPGAATGAYQEVKVRRADGSAAPVEVAVSEMRLAEGPLFTVIVRDVSERKRAEIELRHAQKLEAMGQLATGIAHEINTPMQFVGDNTRFLSEGFQTILTLLGGYRAVYEAAVAGEVPAALLAAAGTAERDSDLGYLEEEIPKAIRETLDGIDRVAAIVRAMREYAHPRAGENKLPADLNEALRSTLTVARSELKQFADVETEFAELPPVVCHVGDLSQVFLNLLVNAAHAIADRVRASGGRGRIGVRTRREGDHVVIEISDTGCGIPDAVRTMIFDPFFTTKEVGRGTGQGLAIARRIVVDRHGGTLTFESQVGQGTTFWVRLPIEGVPIRREPSVAAA